MHLFTTTAGLHCYLERQGSGKEVGLVTTMGALHSGHLSLIERARRENSLVIVTIFVNPLQFAPTEDFQEYPRGLAQDQELCQQVGVDAIFAPTIDQLYGDNSMPTADKGDELTQVIPPKAMTSVLCGVSRPGFFQGVATVVLKLLNLVRPNRAYFGQKDAQQLAIIQGMVADFKLPVTIVPCPIVREKSGLACSSRNQYLTPEQKAQASLLYKALRSAQKAFQDGLCDRINLMERVSSELARTQDIQVEYVELVDPVTLTPLEQVEEQGLLAIAVHLGTTRLIDNILLSHRKPIVAIDGPAGAGKSTVSRLVAKALGLMYLDTGAMYRAVTWRVLKAGIDLEDEPAIAELVSKITINLTNDQAGESGIQVWVDGEEVTQVIRSQSVTAKVSTVAALSSVRRELLKQQQRWGRQGGVVAEGRDIGTHVFPNAEVKLFLTASVQERARRRQQDLKNRGQEVSLEQLEQEIQQRDLKDSTRAVAPLRKAADAIEVKTDGMSIAEVTDFLVNIYYQQLSPDG
ncbi:bifunctional pantoate--beta-alanine ligase/(d)CMP kinase [Moorena sp. SIO3H5]|uniref:bifunctional pantoate--beta-alanine ligase/(d)CMP kinase n=1 Tax=Moorena sp. SIO3H5 TaxID=2607834 RepID=UPI0013B7A7D9|nr:bifunctional pantoate--beta-alanine ligase/(d)CMP kinase [Moorena sp. SIO3H5]NEO73037.1 bifunctional pantoate--beta-alanine ligase/(d)CMP kinase [Moorena sp. SIO3H5]